MEEASRVGKALACPPIARRWACLTAFAHPTIAGIVSHYAKKINGEKLSDDILALYKKYNGPLVPAYAV